MPSCSAKVMPVCSLVRSPVCSFMPEGEDEGTLVEVGVARVEVDVAVELSVLVLVDVVAVVSASTDIITLTESTPPTDTTALTDTTVVSVDAVVSVGGVVVEVNNFHTIQRRSKKSIRGQLEQRNTQKDGQGGSEEGKEVPFSSLAFCCSSKSIANCPAMPES